MPTPGPERYDDARYPPGTGGDGNGLRTNSTTGEPERCVEGRIDQRSISRENAFQILREDSNASARIPSMAGNAVRVRLTKSTSGQMDPRRIERPFTNRPRRQSHTNGMMLTFIA